MRIGKLVLAWVVVSLCGCGASGVHAYNKSGREVQSILMNATAEDQAHHLGLVVASAEYSTTICPLPNSPHYRGAGSGKDFNWTIECGNGHSYLVRITDEAMSQAFVTPLR